MRVLIVDDERSARQRVRRFLEEVADVEIIGECGDGASAVARIRETRPDVVVLDVQMPEMDGFAVLDALGDARPATIFATAYDHYAVRAFDVHAIDYVLKPVEPERLRDALARARAALTGVSSDARLRALLDEVLRDRRETDVIDGPTERLLIAVDGRLRPIQVADVDWIEAARNYVRLHIGKTVHTTRDSLTTLETRLDPRRFARIHRSAIVNLDRVRELQPWFSGDYVVLLTTGDKLRLSRSYRRAFEARFGHRANVE